MKKTLRCLIRPLSTIKRDFEHSRSNDDSFSSIRRREMFLSFGQFEDVISVRKENEWMELRDEWKFKCFLTEDERRNETFQFEERKVNLCAMIKWNCQSKKQTKSENEWTRDVDQGRRERIRARRTETHCCSIDDVDARRKCRCSSSYSLSFLLLFTSTRRLLSWSSLSVNIEERTKRRENVDLHRSIIWNTNKNQLESNLCHWTIQFHRQLIDCRAELNNARPILIGTRFPCPIQMVCLRGAIDSLFSLFLLSIARLSRHFPTVCLLESVSEFEKSIVTRRIFPLNLFLWWEDVQHVDWIVRFDKIFID